MGEAKKIVLLLALLLGAIYASLFFGGSETILFTNFFNYDFILFEIRIPKTITAIVAGSSLSVAGLILQIIFRNPLAGPYVLGISSGASLAVALGVLSGSAITFLTGFTIGKSFILLMAVGGSFFATSLILFVSTRVSSNVILLIIGLMLSQIFGAIQMALEYFANPGSLKNFVIWGMGSLSNTTLKDLFLYVSISLLGLCALVFFVKPLNAFLIGENYAKNVGINFVKSRFYLILISSVLTGVTTAYCGPIAFVGIAVPVLSRMLFSSSKQQTHLFTSCILGSLILLFSDTICHSIFSNVALPINMITTLVGAPLLIYLMFKNKQW